MANPPFQTLVQVAEECHSVLDAIGIPHVLIGGLAVCLHGYKRDTRDVDVLVRRGDWEKIRTALESQGFRRKNRTEFFSPAGVKISFRFGGEEAKGFEASLPDPADVQFHSRFDDLPGMPVLGDLFTILKHKLECGVLGQRKGGRWARRSKKHFGDVFGLMKSNGLLP